MAENGNVWEIERPEYTHRIKFGGHVEEVTDERGEKQKRWVNTNDILAVPYDTPIPGYQNGTVNTLRLWKATATEEFNLAEFNAGDYAESVAAKIRLKILVWFYTPMMLMKMVKHYDYSSNTYWHLQVYKIL